MVPSSSDPPPRAVDPPRRPAGPFPHQPDDPPGARQAFVDAAEHLRGWLDELSRLADEPGAEPRLPPASWQDWRRRHASHLIAAALDLEHLAAGPVPGPPPDPAPGRAGAHR